jgi:NADPH:quinone reductase-like Zn-dependent oxidoreductase
MEDDVGGKGSHLFPRLQAGHLLANRLDSLRRAQLLSLFVRQKPGTLIAVARKEDLQALREFLEAGTVRPVVDRTFALSDVAEAIRYLRDGRARGKVVVTV